MICMDFDWQIDEFMVYCRSAQLREKSMKSYEQTLRLFERWCMEEMNILTVDTLIDTFHQVLTLVKFRGIRAVDIENPSPLMGRDAIPLKSVLYNFPVFVNIL